MPDSLVTSLRAGRLGRGPFVWIALALTAVTALAVWKLGLLLLTPAAWPLVWLWLWPMDLRLRDMGRSVWTLLLPTLGGAAAAVAGFFLTGMGLLFAGVHDGMGIGAAGGLAGLAATTVVWIAFIAWLAISPPRALAPSPAELDEGRIDGMVYFVATLCLAAALAVLFATGLGITPLPAAAIWLWFGAAGGRLRDMGRRSWLVAIPSGLTAAAATGIAVLAWVERWGDEALLSNLLMMALVSISLWGVFHAWLAFTPSARDRLA